jgi:hypothetical protein
MFLLATGTPGEAKNVICPAVSKFYVFRNDTTGGFALTLKTSGGTGIAVPAGQYKFLYCDGTNVVEAFNSAGALTLSGALSVGGTTTLASNPTLSAGTANQVQYLNGSKVLVGSANLTFDGTALTLGGNPTLSAGTANGVAYLNGSKVVTTGSALTFDGSRFTVSSADVSYAVFNSTNANGGRAEFTNSGVSVGYVGNGPNSITGASTSDLAINATSTMRFGILGTEKLSLTTSAFQVGSGVNVSLLNGTANGVTYLNASKVLTSGSALTFDGGANLSMGGANASTYNTLNVNNTASNGYSRLLFNIGAFGANGVGAIKYAPGVFFAIGTDSDSSSTPMTFNLNNAEQMRLTSTGLGIGTSSPSYQLQVRGTGQDTANLTDAGNKGGSLFLQATGVGVGSGGAVLFGTTFGNQTPFAAIKSFVTDGGTNTKGDLAFSMRTAVGDTSLSEKMRLTSEGNLGVGTSAPYAISVAGKNITVYNDTSLGSVSDNASLYVQSVNRNAVLALFGSATSTNAVNFITGGAAYSAVCGDSANSALFFRTGGVNERMRLDSSGNLGLGVTPSAWGVNQRAIEAGQYAALVTDVTGNSLSGVMHNLVLNGTTYSFKLAAPAYAGAYLFSPGIGNHQWLNSSGPGTGPATATMVPAMTLDASGNLALGQTSASYRVDVLSGADVAIRARTSNNNEVLRVESTGTATAAIRFINTANNQVYIGSDSGALALTTGNLERARITSGGDLLVGATTESAKLYVSGVAATGLTARFDSANNTAVPVFQLITADTTGDSRWQEFYSDGTTLRGSITYNRAGGLVVYNTTSDYRAKDILGPVATPGATIDALKVYEGQMKGATQSRPMLVAHEAQAVAPYSVTGEKDAVNNDGTPKLQQMDVSSLVPLLIAEIQSLRARLAAAGI